MNFLSDMATAVRARVFSSGCILSLSICRRYSNLVGAERAGGGGGTPWRKVWAHKKTLFRFHKVHSGLAKVPDLG